ncbi:MAG TPA: LuxR C-terminal-related transcriptional regulator [Candidatus Dormibacteraeota bacterium]|nr:LuxR C-terminal-related transcriptional regulator [Candidatus Dormibacteraeota bacterium]
MPSVRMMPPPRGLHNVPAELTSFVGRRSELAEVKKRLGVSRLVTLSGPGGVGKTRLAVRAAAEMARAFPDGVWVIELARIQDPLLVPQAVFDALGVNDLSTGWSLTNLADYLEPRHLLLILDNCEHLLDSCAVLAQALLEACPAIRILTTSRQPLGISGEARMLVPPLTLPEDDEEPAVERLLESDAVRLLSERAALVLPTFALDALNAAAVVELCRHLDGMPLALELAAVRLGSLSLEQLNLKVMSEISATDRGDAESRHQTLQATISWSYGLLSDAERVLWARLSVFAGGFDEQAAIEVCSDGRIHAHQVVDLISGLVEKSILARETGVDGPPRYRLLETLRQYGLLRLRELGEEATIRRRHFAWICSLARAAGAWDDRQPQVFNRVYLERDNLWAALQFCVGQPDEVDAAAELAKNLMAYWFCRGPWREVQSTIASLIELAPKDSLAQARLLWVCATLASALNDYAGAGELSREALRIGKQVKDAEMVAAASLWLALSRSVGGDVNGAAELAEAAVALARLMELKPVQLMGQLGQCLFALTTGELDRAIDHGEQAVAISKECGELWERAYALNFLSQARWMRSDRQRAEAEAKEGASCSHRLDDRVGLTYLLETLAWMAAQGNAPLRAATLLGCAQRVRDRSRLPAQSINQPQHGESVRIAADALGQGQFDAAFSRGRAMTVDEAVALATGVSQPPKHRRAEATGRQTLELTRREKEIVGLVAEGLSNKQIAARLVVSERTAESHILNILNKLGFNSRTQIASWAAARDGTGRISVPI